MAQKAMEMVKGLLLLLGMEVVELAPVMKAAAAAAAMLVDLAIEAADRFLKLDCLSAATVLVEVLTPMVGMAWPAAAAAV